MEKLYKTSKDQLNVEESIKMNNVLLELNPSNIQLKREEHVAFLQESLKSLHQNYELLDSSQPWICYWTLHSLELLDVEVEKEKRDIMIALLSSCQSKEGGFGGGPQQQPHLATTYAAVCALCILGNSDKTAYNVINLEKLEGFLWKCRNRDGSFKTSYDNETDLRAIYCAVTVSRLTNTYSSELFKDTAKYISTCQSYDGGFSAVPGGESHAGYSYCGYVALEQLNSENLINPTMLLRWLTHRQMSFEGGFQGRTHKLVDSCYSFWLGAIIPILVTSENILKEDSSNLMLKIIDIKKLQMYVLNNCQSVNGGFVDKPKKPVDLYHTCYGLSGLSLAQTFPFITSKRFSITERDCDFLVPNNPCYNLCLNTVHNSMDYFSKFSTTKQNTL